MQFYKLCINHNGKTWFVSYKFSDFAALHDKVSAACPFLSFSNSFTQLHMANNAIQLKFPKPKGLFQSKNDPKFLEKRRQGLDTFIQQILTESKLLGRYDMSIAMISLHSRHVREFMQLDENQDESSSSSKVVAKAVHDDEEDTDAKDDDTAVEHEDESVDLGPSERRKWVASG